MLSLNVLNCSRSVKSITDRFVSLLLATLHLIAWIDFLGLKFSTNQENARAY